MVAPRLVSCRLIVLPPFPRPTAAKLTCKTQESSSSLAASAGSSLFGGRLEAALGIKRPAEQQQQHRQQPGGGGARNGKAGGGGTGTGKTIDDSGSGISGISSLSDSGGRGVGGGGMGGGGGGGVGFRSYPAMASTSSAGLSSAETPPTGTEDGPGGDETPAAPGRTHPPLVEPPWRRRGEGGV